MKRNSLIVLLCCLVFVFVGFSSAFAETPEELIYKAYDSGDPQKAIEFCSQAIDLDPSYKYAYTARGLAKQETGDLDGAVADFSKAIEISPLFGDAYIWRGEVKKAQGDLLGYEADLLKAAEVRSKGDHALKDLNAAVESSPDDAKRYLDRGYYKKLKKDYAGAISDFDQYLAMVGKPQNNLVLYYRANAKVEIGDIDGAINDFSIAIKMFPENIDAYVRRGELRMANGYQEEGRADIHKASLLKKEKELRELKQLKNKFSESPRDIGILLQMARSKLDLGDDKGALADLDTVIANDKKNAMAYSLRSKARANIGDREGSAADRVKFRQLLRPSVEE